MKKRLLFSLALLGLLTLNSCANENLKKNIELQKETVLTDSLKNIGPKNNIKSQKETMWTDGLKNNFLKKNSKIEFDKFVLTKLITENQYDKNEIDLYQFSFVLPHYFYIFWAWEKRLF